MVHSGLGKMGEGHQKVQTSSFYKGMSWDVMCNTVTILQIWLKIPYCLFESS